MRTQHPPKNFPKQGETITHAIELFSNAKRKDHHQEV